MALKRRESNLPTRFAIPMAPMIDVTFLLLMFFMCNLRVSTSEADFRQNLPVGGPKPVLNDDVVLPEIKVGLKSDRDGRLISITIGSKDLGNDDAAFDQLSDEVLTVVRRLGNPLRKDVEVEIDADFETEYRHVMKAVSKCTGRLDPQTKQVARYIEKIKFAPPHKPKE